MQVHVRYMAQLKPAAGTAAETVEVPPGCGIAGLTAILAERHGDAFRRLVHGSGGELRPCVLFFIGDAQVTIGQAVTLREGDMVTLMTPIAGG
jgi:molybdopterin converting factor small subunit